MNVGFVSVLVPVVVGALIGIIPSWLLEARKERSSLRARWEEMLYAASVDLATAARRTEHLTDQLASGDTANDQAPRLDDEHQHLRVAVEQIRLVGDYDAQVAAQAVLHQAYAYRVLVQRGADPYPSNDGAAPDRRLAAARLHFYRAVRRQLRVPNAADLAPKPIHGRPVPQSEQMSGGGRPAGTAS